MGDDSHNLAQLITKYAATFDEANRRTFDPTVVESINDCRAQHGPRLTQ
jgi:hypothetical protein